MKNKTMLMILAVVVLSVVLFVVGCSDTVENVPGPVDTSHLVPEEPEPTPPEDIPRTTPPSTAPSDVAVPLEPVQAATGETIHKDPLENPERGIYKIQRAEPRRYLTVEHMDFRRLSTDKGLLNRLNFTLRNIGRDELKPIVTIEFEKGTVGKRKPAIVEQEIQLPTLPAGYKINKYVPTNIRFHDLDRLKRLSISVRGKYDSSRTDLATIHHEFYPMEVLRGEEITWT